MTQIEEIKAAMARLCDEERLRLREWLAELDSQRFDARIERDTAAGKLDALMEKARTNARAGRRQEL